MSSPSSTHKEPKTDQERRGEFVDGIVNPDLFSRCTTMIKGTFFATQPFSSGITAYGKYVETLAHMAQCSVLIRSREWLETVSSFSSRTLTPSSTPSSTSTLSAPSSFAEKPTDNAAKCSCGGNCVCLLPHEGEHEGEHDEDCCVHVEPFTKTSTVKDHPESGPASHSASASFSTFFRDLTDGKSKAASLIIVKQTMSVPRCGSSASPTSHKEKRPPHVLMMTVKVENLETMVGGTWKNLMGIMDIPTAIQVMTELAAEAPRKYGFDRGDIADSVAFLRKTQDQDQLNDAGVLFVLMVVDYPFATCMAIQQEAYTLVDTPFWRDVKQRCDPLPKFGSDQANTAAVPK